MLQDKNICFLGAGSMAQALISGLISKELINPRQICALNRGSREKLEQLSAKYGIAVVEREEAVSRADIIVLAVKPKDIETAIEEIKQWTRPDQLFISVLAGISTDAISRSLGHHAPVIRSMPNTSAAIGLSATGISPGKYASRDDLEHALAMFEAVGIAEIVTENEMHAVTGLSGSGPAYVYYLVEAMEAAGDKIGLPPETARRLILQTIIGAAHMLQETNEEPAVLRKQVTSPNGTTAAGIEILERYRFQEAMDACIRRAVERSEEMGADTAHSSAHASSR
ncbi:pyrroline-5-carboxylate reductase [Aneurinibacillus sp. Ricciae_BoGa-3]|uniref:pyrroline-5-carboxylate reductase n=1 Tax=Aneurinibacillus sp. Ricciae_BoGa-3 TaxID=3022697 RepID=UPI00233FF01D|nr:pyrroline-5-carboxylate reductase [Aneurinibacillus sp. Ricciae_BoGa-3]WCK53963.1 pyrroline-5-carboxylate reductase [Aneurinibacillus sp. Ricciae_BoGa-3]